jgi:hypothetical protein
MPPSGDAVLLRPWIRKAPPQGFGTAETAAVPCPGRIIASMATSAKRSSASRGYRTARSSTKHGLSSKPSIRFYYPAPLRKKTLSVLGTLEQARDATVHRGALADAVVKLTNSGMDYYFMRPLKLAKPGFIVQQSANLGMAGAEQMMGSVIRNIIGRMDRPQLLSVCGSIRQLML